MELPVPEGYTPEQRKPQLIWQGRNEVRTAEPLPAQAIEVIRPVSAFGAARSRTVYCPAGFRPLEGSKEATMATATIDERYRITIPFEAREGLKPGDVLFVVRETRPEGPMLHAAKAVNPFDALIELGREEAGRGAEIPLEEFARKHGLELAALERQRDALAALAEDARAQCARGETIDLDTVIRTVGLDPAQLPDHLTPEQEQRLVDALNG